MSYVSALTRGAAHGARYVYDRRRPELGTLHQVVRENVKTLYAATEQGFGGTPLPDFVRAELEGYVDCGLLSRGFALLSCEGCPQKKLVAFSCRGRGFCPSCMGWAGAWRRRPPTPWITFCR